jgi:hypothetical protein
MKAGSLVIAKTLDAVGLVTSNSTNYIEIRFVFYDGGIAGMQKHHFNSEDDVNEEWLVAPNPAYAAECMGMLKIGDHKR